MVEYASTLHYQYSQFDEFGISLIEAHSPQPNHGAVGTPSKQAAECFITKLVESGIEIHLPKVCRHRQIRRYYVQTCDLGYLILTMLEIDMQLLAQKLNFVEMNGEWMEIEKVHMLCLITSH